MERKDNIRKALTTFLPSHGRPEPIPVVKSEAAFRSSSPASPPGSRLTLSESQQAILSDLQASLRKHGIDAGLEEIGHGILEALAARPSLCRGLLAAYLVDL